MEDVASERPPPPHTINIDTPQSQNPPSRAESFTCQLGGGCEWEQHVLRRVITLGIDRTSPSRVSWVVAVNGNNMY